MSGVIPVLPLYVFMPWAGATSHSSINNTTTEHAPQLSTN